MTPLLSAVAPAGSESILDQFGWHPQLFLSQVVLFVLLALILKKFAYAPLLAMLAKRQQQISESTENAEKTRKELASAQVKAQELITQASLQANKIIEEARAAAGVVGEQERQRAVAAAQNIVAKAHEAGAAELAHLKTELRKEFGRLVVQAAARTTGDVLSVDQKNRIADESVRQLSA